MRRRPKPLMKILRFQAATRREIEALDHKSHQRHRAGDQERDPAAFAELQDDLRHQDEAREEKTEAVDEDLAFPRRDRLPLLPPVPDHARLGETKGDENVDGVQDDQEHD